MWPGGHQTTDARCVFTSSLVCVFEYGLQIAFWTFCHPAACHFFSLFLRLNLSRLSWQTVSNNHKLSDFLVGSPSHLRLHDNLPKEKSQCPLQDVTDGNCKHRQTHQQAHMKHDLKKYNECAWISHCCFFYLYQWSIKHECMTANGDFPPYIDQSSIRIWEQRDMLFIL